MACDGEIADEEVSLIKNLDATQCLFNGIEVEQKLNEYVSAINEKGKFFLDDYLRSLGSIDISIKQQLKIIEIAIKTIEADNQVLYSEISFFKKIRSRLSISDREILDTFPDKEDYLLPDIKVKDNLDNWDNVVFNTITFNV